MPEDVHGDANHEEREEQRDGDLEKCDRLREAFHRELRHPREDEREERKDHAAEFALAEFPARAHVHAPAQALRDEERERGGRQRHAGLHRPLGWRRVPGDVVEKVAQRSAVVAHESVRLGPCFARSITAAKKPSV